MKGNARVPARQRHRHRHRHRLHSLSSGSATLHRFVWSACVLKLPAPPAILTCSTCAAVPEITTQARQFAGHAKASVPVGSEIRIPRQTQVRNWVPWRFCVMSSIGGVPLSKDERTPHLSMKASTFGRSETYGCCLQLSSRTWAEDGPADVVAQPLIVKHEFANHLRKLFALRLTLLVSCLDTLARCC